MTKDEYKEKLTWLKTVPKTWSVKPLSAVTKERPTKGSSGEMLSVYLDRGVIRASQGNLGTHAPSEAMDNYQAIEPGDFILNNQQAWRGSVGVSFEHGIISPAYLVLRLSQELDWRYSNYLFRARPIVDQFMLASQGVGSIQRQIHAPSFKNVLTIVPPLETQKSIADFLDERTKAIDNLVAKKEKMIELLREKRQSLITQVVTKGFNPKVAMKSSGIDWLGEVPSEWKKLPLKFLFRYHSGGVWGDEARNDDGDVICVRVADFDFTEFVAHSSEFTIRSIPGIKKELILDEDSILLEKSGGGDQQPVGRAVRYLGAEKATCSNFIQKLQVDKKYNSEFIILLLSMLYFNGVTMKVIKKTTGIQNLDLGAFLRTDIFLPSKEEQKKIVEFINAKSLKMTDVMKVILRQIDQLKEYRSSLIYSAVTGKIKV
jgi:type I restriction enzyme S subunit